MSGPVERTKDLRAVAALLAVFALLVQALMPSAAMAKGPHLLPGDSICWASGVHAPAAEPGAATSHKTFGGMPCQDCLAAALAVVNAPTLDIQPVAYVTGRIEHVVEPTVLAPRARAPPRPPGQGPPTT